MQNPLDYESKVPDATESRSAAPLLIVIRWLAGTVTLWCSWLVHDVWFNGSSGNAAAKSAQLDVLYIGLGGAFFFGACFVLSFGRRKR
jgi:hypothetical protein